MRLLADLGNTRLKLARFDGRHVQELESFAHAEPDYRARLAGWLESVTLPRQLWLASVAGSVQTEATISVFEQAGLIVHLAKTQAQVMGLTLAYPRVEQLGVDRWLALLALHVEGKAPCVSVSVGTALTCDALAPHGEHLGGVIAPAPEAMRAALLARAPALDTRRGSVSMFARSTQDGIESGCVLAGVALVERTVRELSTRLACPVRLVISGGAATPLRPYLMAHEYRPGLVLEGLGLWAHAHHDARV